MLVPLSVRDVMTESVETVSPDVTVAEASRRLRRAEIGSLVVCENDEPVGIVTEADVVRTVALELDPSTIAVREFMSKPVVTVAPDESLETAAELLRENDFRRLPVVEHEPEGSTGVSGRGSEPRAGRLIGIVTTTDLSYFLPHLADRRRRATPPSEEDFDDEDWLSDFEGELPLSVGDAVRFTKTLSDEDVRAFARASGDTNRLHLDDEFATKTRFQGRIAHGALTSGVVSAALARLPGLTVYLEQDVSYLGPVEVGETVTAVCEVQEVLGGDRYRLSTAVFDGDGDRVLDGEATVLVDDLPAGEEAVLNEE